LKFKSGVFLKLFSLREQNQQVGCNLWRDNSNRTDRFLALSTNQIAWHYPPPCISYFRLIWKQGRR